MTQRKEGFLKFIIVYKALMGVIELVISIGFISLLNVDIEDAAAGLAAYFNLDIDNRYVSAMMQKVVTIGNGTILSISIGVFSIGVINTVEAYGLHLRRRWAEWLTVVATSVFIPFEIYEVIERVTPVRVGILVLNCAIVYYLAKHKELFKRKRN